MIETGDLFRGPEKHVLRWTPIEEIFQMQAEQFAGDIQNVVHKGQNIIKNNMHILL